MTVSKPRENAPVWMSGGYAHPDMKLETALVTERLSTLTEIQVEFTAKRPRLDLATVVGRNMTVHVLQDDMDGNGRMFTGTCISAEAIDSETGIEKYVAEVRPWFWMLTLTRNNRVFQNMTVKQIIEEVISDHGFAAFIKLNLTAQYEEREYCVQYRESDFDFLSRLMEEEGLFYYFDHSDAFEQNEKLVICDGTIGLGDLEGDNQIDYNPMGKGSGERRETMTSWGEGEALVRGKVSIRDYDFEVPSTTPEAVSNDPKGDHSHTQYEYYDLPGHFRQDQARGDRLAKVRLGADTARHKEYEGSGTHRYMGAGHTFTLSEHPTAKLNKEYLVVSARHHLYDPMDFSGAKARNKLGAAAGETKDEYSYAITAIDKADQFRAPMVTPWPRVPGVQTGVVVGPDGSEIHTDEHGRIKVHFRWDRVNEKNDNASCWIRVASQWSGTNWGLNHVPRMGQEVLIQFEDGDPDRPIVTGMLYNAETMPPYVDPAQPTRTGLMTRSSPEGGQNDYNALVFEDKAGSEYTHFQSQKDYQMVVKDSAQITIGDDGTNVSPDGQSVAAGSLLQTVKKNVTELVEEGDKKETIKSGKLDLTVQQDMNETVEIGNKTETVKVGNMSQVVKTGNMSLDVQLGKIDISALQAITIESQIKIELKVGGSSIVVDQTGVKIQGAIMAEVKSPMTTVKADAMLVLQGALTKIN